MAGDLRNRPEREEAFKDWGLGMFVHWSFDSQLGSVISHSMDYASHDYLDRYVNELPKTLNPKKFDPDEWMGIAKVAGAKYMVLTAKHHNGFCMWDTKTTDFSIMNTAYGKDIVRQYVDACRRHGLKVGFYYSPEDFAFHYERDIPARGGGDGRKYYDELVAYTKKHLDELLSNYGEIDVIFLDGGHKAELAEYVQQIAPDCLVTRGEMVTPEQKLPQEPIPGPWETCFTLGNQWQYKPTNEDYKSGTRFKQTEDGLEVSVKRAQRLYNNRRWPNAVVLRLENVEFAELVAQ